MEKRELLTEKYHFIRSDIVDDIILDTPFDEIQLRQCCMDFMRCPWYDVPKLLRSTKWIKKFLTVPI